MRDRLIDLIKRGGVIIPETAEAVADHLLANGVIVPPFPIGTKYYRIVNRTGKHAGEYQVIREAELNYYNIENVLRDFGKTVFLSREEAENALKGGEPNNGL